MDSKPVSVISIEYGDNAKVEMERWHKKSKQQILFPQAFSKYNMYMGGVDLHDQHCNALMPTIHSKKWTWCLFLRLIQAALSNATVFFNKLHPDERKNTKNIVEQVCEYYIEKFENADRPKRKNRSASSAGVVDKHKIIIGKRYKFEAENCFVYTKSYCSLCEISLCKKHRKNHA